MCSGVLSSRYSAASASRRSISIRADSRSRRRATVWAASADSTSRTRRSSAARSSSAAQPGRGGELSLGRIEVRGGQQRRAGAQLERVEQVAQLGLRGADRDDHVGARGKRRLGGRLGVRRHRHLRSRGGEARAQRLGVVRLPARDEHAGTGQRVVHNRPSWRNPKTHASVPRSPVTASKSGSGRGGMGVVYRAQHMNLQRRAAIKIIAPEFADTKGFRSRFIREARIAAALQHPNIVTVYDAGQSGQTLYIAMQFIRGSDPRGDPQRGGPAAALPAIDVCRQVASALDAAHGMALIHRDVKPGNVLIEGRRAYLTDFGLTKRSGGSKSGLTQAGSWWGRSTTSRPSRSRPGTSTRAPTSTRSPACCSTASPATCRSSATPTWRSSTRT
jgi:hypothetical protein